MEDRSRREFLSDVGKGMLVASIGGGLVSQLGLPALAEPANTATAASAGGARLAFGKLEPLVELMQETAPEKLLPLVVERIQAGTALKEIVSAAALANARTFGGEDYIGFHTFMALLPSYEMSKEMPADRRALPVLKVLYRNANQIQTRGGRAGEVLHPIDDPSAADANRHALQDAVHHQEVDRAEQAFAAMVARNPKGAYDDLQALIQDDTDVHRTVLAYRAWSLLDLTGREHAHTTLRQSVRYCAKIEKGRIAAGYGAPGIRTALPMLLDKHKLEGRTPGNRSADDAWLDRFVDTLLHSTPEQAADTVAAALAEGFSLDAIGEGLSLTATEQVLRDPGRTVAYPGKPIGSVHGDSVGVHASDSMNAWRNIAKVTSPATAMASFVVAGYHLQTGAPRNWAMVPPYAQGGLPADLAGKDSATLLRELDGAIRENNQARAAWLVRGYTDGSNNVRPLLDVLLRYATSEDGSLHAEKYYKTTTEEYGRTRKGMRAKHLIALGRVTASEYGKRADGYEQACQLLKVRS